MNHRLKAGFGLVSNNVIRNPDISMGEKALYAYLCTYADANTSDLFVSVNKMADEMGISVSSIKRYLLSLEKKGVLDRKNRGYRMSKTTSLLK